MPRGVLFPPLGMSVDSKPGPGIESMFYITLDYSKLHYITLHYMPRGVLFPPLGMSVDSIDSIGSVD